MSRVFSSPSAFNLKIRNLIYAAPVFLLIAVVAPSGKAQSCDNIPQGGGESILASATIDGTTTELTNGAFLTAGTRVRLDSVVTSSGECLGMAWNCQTSPCVCQSSGYTYPRTVNHTNVNVDITSAGVWNGTYFVGTVQFWNNYAQTLDSKAADTTGQTISLWPSRGLTFFASRE